MYKRQGNIVIRDRQNLSENGIIVVTLSLEKGTNNLLAGPDIAVYKRQVTFPFCKDAGGNVSQSNGRYFSLLL